MNAAQRIVLGTRKGLVELQRSDSGWSLERLSFSGDPVSITLHDSRDGTDYAALNLGHFGVKLHRREAGAADWTEIAVPTYPEQPAEAKDGPAWKLVLIWSLAAGGADEPGVLWAGTLPGGLFRSADRGDSWQLVRSLWDMPQRAEWFGGGYDVPGIHSICVHPSDPRALLVGVSCGGAWASQDGGQSWQMSAAGMRATYMPPERELDQSIQDPHLIVRCQARPEVLWSQHHSGIWRSTDSGASWQKVEAAGLPSDFGFTVAVHPQDPDTAWFVPAVADQNRVPVGQALCVTRTRDGGKSFETLRQGLPQSNCFDLVYRHGLAVSADGQQLAMASTTGGVWTSADGGEHWQQLFMRLPPVYSVRFA